MSSVENDTVEVTAKFQSLAYDGFNEYLIFLKTPIKMDDGFSLWAHYLSEMIPWSALCTWLS